VIRLRRTRGVAPMERELSSNQCDIETPYLMNGDQQSSLMSIDEH